MDCHVFEYYHHDHRKFFTTLKKLAETYVLSLFDDVCNFIDLTLFIFINYYV